MDGYSVLKLCVYMHLIIGDNGDFNFPEIVFESDILSKLKICIWNYIRVHVAAGWKREWKVETRRLDTWCLWLESYMSMLYMTYLEASSQQQYV